MANNENVHVTFTGSAAGLQSAANQASKAVGQVATSSKQMSATMIAQGAFVGTVMAKIGESALRMAKSTITSFSSVASEVRRMKGIMGGTAEDVSRLRFAGEELGVSAESIAKAYRFLSTHLVANDKYAQQLGVQYKNLDGSLRAPQKVLGEVADRLNELPAGAERSALAAKLFGRGFAEINPILNAGSEGLAKLAQEADDFGMVLKERDLKVAKEFKMSVDALEDGLKGLALGIGSAIMPTLTAMAQSFETSVKAVRRFFIESETAQTILKVLGGIIAAVTAAFVIYKGVLIVTATWTKLTAAYHTVLAAAQVLAMGAATGLSGIMAALNTIMMANPAALVATAIIGLVLAFITLMKTSETFRNIFTNVMGWIGNVGGKALAGIVFALKMVGTAYINLARIIVKAGEIATGNRFWKAIFGGGANESVKSALDALDSFENKFKEITNKVISTAWNKGTDIGRGLGKSIGNAIKNIKLPSFKMPDVKDQKGDSLLGAGGAGAAGSSAAEKAALDKLKNYWQKRIDLAKDAFNAAKQVTQDAARSISGGFDITEITRTSFAKYLGSKAMTDLYRKKLADAKEFVNNIRTLKALGLPVPMLQQLAAAGAEGGLDAARVLLSDTGAITQLKDIQSEIDSAAADMGNIIAGAVGPTMTEARTGLNTEIQGARNAGLTVTEDVSAGGDINISVDVATDADPQEIADSVAFAIVSNTPVVAKPKAKPVKAKPSAPRPSAAPAVERINAGRFKGKQIR